MILSCWGDQYSHLSTVNIKVHPLIFQILFTEQDVARSLVPILATKELVAPLAYNPIMLGDWYGCLDTTKIQICPLVMILCTVLKWSFSIFGLQGGIGATCKWFYHLGMINMVVWTPITSKSVHYFRWNIQLKRIQNSWHCVKFLKEDARTHICTDRTMPVSYWTRNSRCYAPFHLAPAEGWVPLEPLRPWRPYWGMKAPSSQTYQTKPF